ncbi:MAG: hypothetical protein OXR73_28385 [Myxococcales bacterium]|nr:hypothetical protein [Myxococcales bacterium]
MKRFSITWVAASVGCCLCAAVSAWFLLASGPGSVPDAADPEAAGSREDVARTNEGLSGRDSPRGSVKRSGVTPGLPPAELRDFSQGSAPVEAIVEYFRDAKPNLVAARTLERVLDAHRASTGLRFASAVACRGWICRVEAAFEELEQAKSLYRMPRPPEMEFIYAADVANFGKTRVTAFGTLSGTTFAEVVADREPKSSLFSQNAALDRAQEIDERW